MLKIVYLIRNSIAVIILLLVSVMTSTLALAAQDDAAVKTFPLANQSPENDGNAANEEITPDSHETDVASDNLTVENDPTLNHSTDIDSDTTGNGVVPDNPETDAVSDKPAIVNEPVKDSSLEINDNPIDHKVMPNHVSMIDAGTNTSDQANQSKNDYNLPIILVVLCFVALVVSLWVNLFLLKWRRSVTAGDVSIVPSELLGIVSQQTKAVTELKNQQRKHSDDLFQNLTNFASLIERKSDETHSSSSELLVAFTGLQKSLTDKDTEIERLRNGYDFEIYRKFLNRFIKLERIVGEEIEDLCAGKGDAVESLKDIETLLRQALAECGLTTFEPEIGASICDTDGVDENYKRRPAEKPEQALTIAEVIEPGWRIKTAAGYEYAKKARVIIYVQEEVITNG